MDNALIRVKIKEIKLSSISKEEKIVQMDNLVKGLSTTRTTRSYIKQAKTFLNKQKKVVKEVFENKQSYGENLVECFLKKHNILYIKEKTFPDLVNIHTNCNLRFDFYLPEIDTCIEFDGKQHFFYVKEFDKGDKSKVKYRQYLDELKNIYCENKKLKLIRINYKQYKKVDSILTNLLA